VRSLINEYPNLFIKKDGVNAKNRALVSFNIKSNGVANDKERS
jgi:hypothetical protein